MWCVGIVVARRDLTVHPPTARLVAMGGSNSKPIEAQGVATEKSPEDGGLLVSTTCVADAHRTQQCLVVWRGF